MKWQSGEYCRNGLRTWIEVDTSALAHNYATLRSRFTADTSLGAVIKSNAYGHGLLPFAQHMEKLGVEWLMVDSIVEARTLRNNAVDTPILVLGYTLPEYYSWAAEYGVRLSISSYEALKVLQLRTEERVLSVHIKVDTGMHRQGFLIKELDDVLAFIQNLPKNVHIEGLYTHLASAKDPQETKCVEEQIKEFDRWRRAFMRAGIHPVCHAAASGGALLFDNSHFDLARIGIALYGLWPSKQSYKQLSTEINLQPVLTWKTIITETKKLPRGSRIGYEGSEELVRDSRIAVIPVGYWHGYPRAVSGKGEVLIAGVRCRVLGRVSMDMTVVDITEASDVAVGDEVVLLGSQGVDIITAIELAELVNTTHYEILTRLNSRIQRKYI